MKIKNFKKLACKRTGNRNNLIRSVSIKILLKFA